MADEFEKVAEVSEIPLGKTKIVRLGGIEMFVANIEGSFFAMSNKCTHVGAPLSRGMLIGNVIQCPWHGSRFDVKTGAVLKGPAQQRETTFEVKVEGNSIWVKKPT
ncbi:MAG TPA: non-heme iron oxygenase ferredoxin subunit [Nitrososphaerales archaeon]|nr:non-heme iron oxygenase ferredoxin subunit [Nitrososphaerales archaeon]